MTHQGIGLYIHIPFCQSKCNYCDFNTYARLEPLVPSYMEALSMEIAAWGERLHHPPVRTVFFGGGTPSWVPPESLAAVLDASRRAFLVQADAEITAEANPNDVTPEKMRRWREMGVNRASMGVQSFEDGLLKLLSRRHSAAEAVAAYRTLKDAGFANVNIDLIYGLPTQSLDLWQRTLERAIELAPSHLSLYALTIEEGTPLWKDVEQGRLPRPDPDLAAGMYELAEELLDASGYQHYEISNWARPGCECRHNLLYWRNEPFLGVGPGAHSYLNGERFWNIKSPAEYVRRFGSPLSPRDGIPVIEGRQPVSLAQELSETLILRLRLAEGVAPDGLVPHFGEEALGRHRETLRRFQEIGLVSEEGSLFRLTRRGRLLSNELFVHLLPQ